MPITLKSMPAVPTTGQPAIIKRLIDALRAYKARHEEQKTASSEDGKARRRAGKAFLDWSKETRNHLSSVVGLDGMEFSYGVTTSERIDPREWYNLWQAKEISEQQFFEAVSVSKDEASRSAGADRVQAMCRPVRGKAADLRMVEAEKPTKGFQVRPAQTAAVNKQSVAQQTGPVKAEKPKRTITLRASR